MPADQDGLARLALTIASKDVRGCIEMMSGAVWVRDQLAQVGWDIRLADARKVKAIAPLAWKTDRVDARVLADFVHRDLIPEETMLMPTLHLPTGRPHGLPDVEIGPRSTSTEPTRSPGVGQVTPVRTGRPWRPLSQRSSRGPFS